MYLDCKFGLNLSLSEIILLFDISLYLDRTLAQRKAKSKVKVAHCRTDLTYLLTRLNLNAVLGLSPNDLRNVLGELD